MSAVEAAFAALGSLAGPGVLGLGGQRDVVVDKLPPGHQQDRHRVVVETLVLNRKFMVEHKIK